MTRLERELLTTIEQRVQALLPLLRKLARAYEALGAAVKATVEKLLPELSELLQQFGETA